jgi:transposase
MATPGPRKIKRYPDDFKVSAVKMSHEPGVLIKDVAESLCIHPFMLSLWRKQVRDGTLKGVAAEVDEVSTSELKRLRELERKYKLLEQEHDLLKKAIRFVSDPSRTSSPSSKQTVKRTRSK